MAEAWPGSLPSAPLVAGFSLAFENRAIEFVTASGRVRTRARSSSVRRRFTIPMVLTLAQTQTFRTFFETTLKGGVETVTYTDPVAEASVEFRIVGDPAANAIGVDLYAVSFNAEMV